MESPVTFYTIINKDNQLLLLNGSITYSVSYDTLKDFLQDNPDIVISEVTLKKLEDSAREMKVDIYEISPFGGTFKFQKLIIFGSEIIH